MVSGRSDGHKRDGGLMKINTDEGRESFQRFAHKNLFRVRDCEKSHTLRKPNRLRQPRNGFTLVELLVVISIIALLISLLLPALNRAREVALSVSCMANERQISIATLEYTDSNDGQLFPGGWDWPWVLWPSALVKYLNLNPNLNFQPTMYQYQSNQVLQCPAATIPWTSQIAPGGNYTVPGTNTMWSAYPWWGSYAYNDWLYNGVYSGAYPAFTWTPTRTGGNSYNWPGNPSSTDISTSLIPLICDGDRIDTGYGPFPTDPAPPDLYDSQALNTPFGMWALCINRHQGSVNIGYLDGHVASVHLRDLWKQHWYDGWVPPNPLPTLPG